ncbi:response regulator [Marinicella meishanensis]|uniref:response regulator n=1 Tax=Marinicella meishanensis TaxID=2873263 RepID=UPI001CC04BA0|nr:response regulator [Marinicella sp. NBU2979]
MPTLADTVVTQPRPQVLLVDDEPRILRSLRAALKRDYDITTASNGRDAQKIIKANANLSVIISDERMPGLLGHELLAWSKQHRPQVTRILMTGYSDLQAIQNSINEAEVFKYITKPWNIGELKAVIDDGIIHENTHHQFLDSDRPEPTNECLLAIMNRVNSNDGIYHKVAKSLAKKTVMADDIGAVFNVLERHSNVGVLFVDDDRVDADTVNTVTLIHEKYPSVVIIVATSAADGNSAIKLLNSGQIFRYLVKPLTATRLLPMLQAAIKQYEEKAAKQAHIKQAYSDDTGDSLIKAYWQKVMKLWH